MPDLVVHPSVVVGPEDIITADLLNLLATPVVDLAIAEPVNDQNFLRNGNFYSSFWVTPAGMTCPVGVETSNANYWYVKPQGAAVTCRRSTTVPDTNSLFSFEIDGAVGATDVEFGQHISGDLSATLRRVCTFSSQIFNNTGLVVSAKLRIYSCNAFNNFNAMTLQATVDLQTCPNGIWTFVSTTLDLSTLSNVANGISVVVLLPSGTLTAATKIVNFSRTKFQIGEVATEFTDDVSLFVQSPSVDSTMLQDGCIARPSLFLSKVVPAGAYVNKSIVDGDIADNTITSRALAPSAITGNLGYVPVNKAGDTFIGTASIASTGTLNSTVNVTEIPSTAGMSAGMLVYGTGIPAGTTISSVTSSTALVLSAAATVNATASPFNVVTQSGGVLGFLNDDVVGTNAYTTAAIQVNGSVANAANDGYMPAIAFNRPGHNARALGIDINNRFKMVDQTGAVGFLLDTVTKVDTASYQDASITYAKLAQSLINLICPVGMIITYAGPGVPSGYLPCDGSWQSRASYSALFSVIGTYWGAADGNLYFALPDFRGRIPLGYVNTGTNLPGGISSRGFGSYGGEESTSLAVGHLPVHNHSITDQSHTHGLHNDPHTHSLINPVGALGSQPGSGQYSASGGTNTGAASINVYMDAAYSNINHTENTGSNVAHNTMQPFAVCYYLIKAI